MPDLQGISSLPLPNLSPVEAVGSKLHLDKGRALKEMTSDFEAMFLSLLLKEMRQTLEPGGLFAGDSGDVQGGLFDMFMSQHLAAAGGFGLANQLQEQLRTPLESTRHADGSTTDRGTLPRPPGA